MNHIIYPWLPLDDPHLKRLKVIARSQCRMQVIQKYRVSPLLTESISPRHLYPKGNTMIGLCKIFEEQEMLTPLPAL